MNPLEWLRAQYARITQLPARLDAIIDRANRAVRSAPRSGPQRERAARIWADALQDRAEVRRLLRDHIRTDTGNGLSGLGLAPVVLIVGGLTAAGVMATLVGLFGRASAYERELALIESGSATVEDIERLRDDAPVGPGGVTATIRESANLLKVALVGAAGLAAFKLWGKR